MDRQALRALKLAKLRSFSCAALAVLAGCEAGSAASRLWGSFTAPVPAECTSSADCTADPARPICGSNGRCEPCATSAQCFERATVLGSHDRADSCVHESRADAQAGSCAACTTDAECASGFCFKKDMQTLTAASVAEDGGLVPGQCFPPSSIAHVRYSAGCVPGSGNGSEELPYCSVSEALSALTTQLRVAIKLLSSSEVHPAITVQDGRKVLLTGPDTTATGAGLASLSTVRVQGSSQLVLERVKFAVPAGQAAAQCDTRSELLVRRSVVTPAPGFMNGFVSAYGIDSQRTCVRLLVEQTFFRGVDQFGIRARARYVRVVNNALVQTEGVANYSEERGAIVAAAESGIIAYNTVVNNGNTVACADGNGARLVANIIADNSNRSVSRSGAMGSDGCPGVELGNYAEQSVTGQHFPLNYQVQTPGGIIEQLRLFLDPGGFFGRCCVAKTSVTEEDGVYTDFFGCTRPAGAGSSDFGFHQHDGTGTGLGCKQ